MSASDLSAQTAQMRRVRVAGPDDIRVEKVPIPQPGAGELLISSQLIGVCGSDLHAVRGDHPFMTFPFSRDTKSSGRWLVMVPECRNPPWQPNRGGTQLVLRPVQTV